MQVGMTRAQTYEPLAARFVLPSALGVKPPEETRVPSRSEVFKRTAKPVARAMPDEGLRSAQVGQHVVNRTLTASVLDVGIQAYRRQDEQLAGWRNQGPQERDRTSITPAVSSTAGGVVKGSGSFLDMRV